MPAMSLPSFHCAISDGGAVACSAGQEQGAKLTHTWSLTGASDRPGRQGPWSCCCGSSWIYWVIFVIIGDLPRQELTWWTAVDGSLLLQIQYSRKQAQPSWIAVYLARCPMDLHRQWFSAMAQSGAIYTCLAARPLRWNRRWYTAFMEPFLVSSNHDLECR